MREMGYMISVIIPTYNGLDMLRKSLPTWFAQTLPPEEYEIIVVDNRSVDGTRQFVESLLPEHKNLIYLYEPKPGATNARHAGAHKAKGEYLVFADNDGLFNPECLQEIIKVYKVNKECVAVACRIEILWDGVEPDWIAPYKNLLGQLNYGDEIRYDNHNRFYLNGGLMSVRKDVFERLGGFNPDLIGPYLIGDGDLGFVDKLHAEHALIGWAPNAQMQHMQLVTKHGSKHGIALHCYNNGIADSYALYRKQQFRMNSTMWKFLIVQMMIVLKQYVQCLFHPRDLKRHFALQQHKGNVRFFGLLMKPELRKEIRRYDVYHIDV